MGCREVHLSKRCSERVEFFWFGFKPRQSQFQQGVVTRLRKRSPKRFCRQQVKHN